MIRRIRTNAGMGVKILGNPDTVDTPSICI